MNTRNLLISVLMLVCVWLSACAPAATATPIVQTPVLATAVPATEAPNEFALAGDPIPDRLLNIDFISGKTALRLRPADDPICQEIKTEGNCFTILRTDHDPAEDPGARGPAALVNGLVAAKFQLCPFCDLSEIGTVEYFEPKENGGALVGVKCETKTGAECAADVGSTWSPAPQQTTWHSPENTAFHLPMALNYSSGWDIHIVINDVDLVYMGNPPGPQLEWWGSNVVLLNGAHVLDAGKVTDLTMPVPPLKDLQPVPDDFFAYVASIPGVKVIQGPDPITIDGIQGSQIIVHTPPMRAMLWLKDDYGWHGGGPSGADPEFKRQMIVLEVNGERVLLEFDDSLEKFDEHYPLVQEIFNSITFTK